MFIVLWCFNFTLSYVFLRIFIKMSKLNHLIKVLQCLYIYIKFYSLCQAFLTPGGFNSSTLSCWGGWPKSVHLPVVFTKVLNWLVEHDSSTHLSRVTLVWGPLHGECQEFLTASVFRMKWLLQKLMYGPADPCHIPHVVNLQSLEGREVGLK